MTNPLTMHERAEIDADAYYTALEALEKAERAASKKGIRRSDIARLSGIDPARVTKILSGEMRNITLKTLFILMRVMNRKVFITSKDVADLKPTTDFRFLYSRVADDPNAVGSFSNPVTNPPRITVKDNTVVKSERKELVIAFD